MNTEAKWPVYSLKLKSRSEVAERTLEFRFDKPAGMTFKAGQFMDLTLIEPLGDRCGGQYARLFH